MRLNVAVIGAGAMGMNHLRVLNDFNEEHLRLVGVADLNAAALHHAMNRFHIAGYTDYRQLVEETHPDLVAVVVPTCMHFEVASYVIDQGVNVLIEKPFTSTIDQAVELIRRAHLRNVKIAVGHIERFNPAVTELKRRLVAHELGKVFHLHARRLGPFPARVHDVGVTLDLATHDIDVMRYLVDAEVLLAIGAVTQRRVNQMHEDLLLGILHFTNDAIGVLDVNWLTPTKVRELSITGEKGMYLLNYLTQDVYFYENDYTTMTWDALGSFTGVSEGSMTRLKVRKAEPLRLEYEDTIAALLNDTLPTVSAEDGLAVLKIAHLLVESTHNMDNVRQTLHNAKKIEVAHA